METIDPPFHLFYNLFNFRCYFRLKKKACFVLSSRTEGDKLKFAMDSHLEEPQLCRISGKTSHFKPSPYSLPQQFFADDGKV